MQLMVVENTITVSITVTTTTTTTICITAATIVTITTAYTSCNYLYSLDQEHLKVLHLKRKIKYTNFKGDRLVP